MLLLIRDMNLVGCLLKGFLKEACQREVCKDATSLGASTGSSLTNKEQGLWFCEIGFMSRSSLVILFTQRFFLPQQ
jgi:hypothetical protein